MDVTPLRQNIALQAAQFRAAVSEWLAQGLAGQQNFINYFQYSEKQFFINGPYSITGGSQTFADGMAFFEFKAQIIDAWMFNITPGSSGTTQLDVQVSPAPGSGFTSIFSTKPSIAYNAAGPSWVNCSNPQGGGNAYTPPTYTVPTGCTQGVLNTAVSGVIQPYSAIKVDLDSSQVGGQNCGIVVLYRPI